MEGFFDKFYKVICRHRECIVLLKRCYLLENKRILRFVKLQLHNFPVFLPCQFLRSCLGFDTYKIFYEII